MPRNPRTPRRSKNVYPAGPSLTQPGVKLKVQVVDVSGQNVLNRDAPREWRPCQKVEDLAPFVNDNKTSSKPWEDIVLTQSNEVIEDNVPLGRLVDKNRTVRLTVERVTAFSHPVACAAISKANLFLDTGDLAGWFIWRRVAIEVENAGETQEILSVDVCVVAGTRRVHSHRFPVTSL